MLCQALNRGPGHLEATCQSACHPQTIYAERIQSRVSEERDTYTLGLDVITGMVQVTEMEVEKPETHRGLRPWAESPWKTLSLRHPPLH